RATCPPSAAMRQRSSIASPSPWRYTAACPPDSGGFSPFGCIRALSRIIAAPSGSKSQWIYCEKGEVRINPVGAVVGSQARDFIPPIDRTVDGRHPACLPCRVDRLNSFSVACVVGMHVDVAVDALERADGGDVHAALPARGRNDALPR